MIALSRAPAEAFVADDAAPAAVPEAPARPKKNPRDPQVRIFRSFTGAQPYATFKAVLDDALAETARQ